MEALFWSFWTTEEVDLSKDGTRMTSDELFFLAHALAVFPAWMASSTRSLFNALPVRSEFQKQNTFTGFGSFAAIFQLGLVPGLTFSELISRDEGLHTNFTYLLFDMLQTMPSRDTVTAIVSEQLRFCRIFARRSAVTNADLMSKYIEFVADRLLNKNFFEKKVDEFQKA
ncbi:Ribonucleotide-diphosphate reductase (RNR), small subunit, partial [Entophlyctis luteolus]